MKALKEWLKIIALFFTALILFQSCSAYKTPITLEQAVQEKKKVKIITTTNNAFKYNYIVFEDGQFYGVKADYDTRENIKIPINSDEVVAVTRRGLPTWAWIAIAGGVVLGIVIVAVVESQNFGSPSW